MANHKMSEPPACLVIGSCHMSVRYKIIQQDDPMLRDQLNALAKERRRFGYLRLHVFLRREGHEVNHKRLFWIYREDGGGSFTRRRRTCVGVEGESRPSARGLRLHCPSSCPIRGGRDQMADGRRFPILTVVDECTRECLALIADTSLSGARVARELGALFEARGKPSTIVSD